jgi:hypothetical protein
LLFFPVHMYTGKNTSFDSLCLIHNFHDIYHPTEKLGQNQTNFM